MKKILTIITIIAILSQLIPSVKVVNAIGLSYDVYNSGDIVIMSDGDTKFYIRDSANNYTANSGTSTTTLAKAQVFLPNGDLVVANIDQTVDGTNNNTLTCYTYASNFSTTCSWSGYAVQGTSYTDPSTGGITNAGVDVLIDEPILYMDVAVNGDIWSVHSGLGFMGAAGGDRYVARTLAPSYTTTEIYDLKFSGDTTISPYQITIDLMGDIWITSLVDDYSLGGGATYGTKVYCLDSSNSYLSCTGSAFDSNGGITVDSGPADIVVNSQNDLFVATAVNGKIDKITRSNNFTVTSSSGSYSSLYFLRIDDNDNIWTHTSDANAQVRCLQSDLTACAAIGTESGVSTLSMGTETGNEGLFLSKKGSDQYLWVVQVDWGGVITDDRVYCFNITSGNAASNYACSGTFLNDTNFYTYLPYTTLSDPYAEHMDDPSGYEIKRLFAASAGEGQATISATVDPSISFTLDTTSCLLGNLTSANVNGCEVVFTISANSGTGYIGSVRDSNNGTLNSGSDTVGAVVTSPIAQGQEEYGVSTTDTTSVDIATTTNCNTTPSNSLTSEATALTTSDQVFASGSAPVASDATTLCVSASVTDTTPAGSYTDTLTITAVGYF